MWIYNLFDKWNIKPKGIIHIGAHLCQEREIYKNAGCDDSSVLWIEGNPDIYNRARQMFPDINIYNALISDKDSTVDFIVTNNDGASSSFLELGEHLIHHPDVFEVERKKMKTIDFGSFVSDNNIDMNMYDFLIMDIQGAELHALKGMIPLFKYFNGIYLEVNNSEIYKKCGQLPEIIDFLKQHGFDMKDIHMTQWNWGDAYFSR